MERAHPARFDLDLLLGQLGPGALDGIAYDLLDVRLFGRHPFDTAHLMIGEADGVCVGSDVDRRRVLGIVG